MIVEFKLINGKVPYFIDKYLPYKIKGLNEVKDNDRYLGIVTDRPDEYIPSDLVELTEEEAKTLIKTAKVYEPKEEELNIGEEKVELSDSSKVELLNKKFKFSKEPIILLK